jgi:hypothetical protein
MKFKYYDLLSHLVSGYIIYSVCYYLFASFWLEIGVLPSIALAYVIGFFNNTLASWFEDIYRFSLGGNPINKFLDGSGIWKVNYYGGKKVKRLLRNSFGTKEALNEGLFVEAMRIANANSTARLEDFNAVYAFSRGLVTTILIAGSIIISQNLSNIFVWVAMLLLFIIALIRNRQKEGYYIREILNIAQSVLESK